MRRNCRTAECLGDSTRTSMNEVQMDEGSTGDSAAEVEVKHGVLKSNKIR